MKFHVIEVDQNMVYGNTLFGELRGKWKYDTPIVNTSYEIELDINCVFIYKKNIFRADICSTSISCEGDHVCIFGVLESRDDDGYAVLRMNDSIIVFDLDSCELQVGDVVKLYMDFKDIDMSPVPFASY